MLNLFKIPNEFGSHNYKYMLAPLPTLEIVYDTGEHSIISPVKDTNDIQLCTEDFEDSTNPVYSWTLLFNMSNKAGLTWKKRERFTGYHVTPFARSANPVLYDAFVENMCFPEKAFV